MSAMLLTSFILVVTAGYSAGLRVGQGDDGFVHSFRIQAQKPRDNVISVKKEPVYNAELPTKPYFCHGLDCPDFTVVKKTDNYEERAYQASGWVSTTLTGMDYNEASMEMFQKLFKYISGNNDKKEKIDMTAPVLVSVIPGPGPACESNFTMSFYVSSKVADPPAPLDKTVFLDNLPAQKVFVRSFGGYAFKTQWLENAAALAKDLQKDSQSFNQDFFYSAGYDSPFRPIGRHNEVWYIATKE